MGTPSKVAPQAQLNAQSTAATRPISPARSLLLQKKCACGAGSSSGECESCQKREREQHEKDDKKKQGVQRSAAGRAPATATAPPIVGSVLNSPGRPLDASTRSFMEPRFGRDFSGVRVHTGAQAAESARAVNAHAYTVGQDIVFDHGKYDPGSQSGRQLLAHELAHTVQQQGLQRSADGISLGESGEYHHLEREADSVAHAVMSGESAPALATRPSRPLVSRAGKGSKDDDDKKPTAASTKAPKASSDRDWEDIDKSSLVNKGVSDLKSQGVTQIAQPPAGASTDILAFNMGVLILPKEKGKKEVIEPVWKDTAARGALQAIIEPSGDIQSTKVGLKQVRPPTDELKRIWLQKVGWPRSDAEKNWKGVTTKKDSFLGSLTASQEPCQIDHILELQFGGNNVKENMQVLDGPENMQSGREIFQGIKNKAIAIRAALKKDGLTPKEILLFYEDASQPSGTCGPCCKAEQAAQGVKGVGEDQSVGGKTGEQYPITAGGPPTYLLITEPYLSDKKKAMPIAKSDVPENKSAATIISGLLLTTLHRVSPGHDTIDAIIDKGSKLPVSMKGEKGVPLHVAKDGKLSFAQKRPNLEFHYDYLSDGVFTRMDFMEDGSISGEGTIKPTVPFLPQLHVKFDKDSFALVAPLDAKKLKPPIPGAKITEGEFGLQLAPEFKPYGAFAFELARGPKKFLDGRLDVTADAQGLVAKGALHAYIPGVDKAEGTITYQNHDWTGGVDIEASQLQSKLKYVKSGSAKIGLSKKGISAEGKFVLDIPKTDGITVQLFFENSRWLLRGTGKFKPPKLEETEISVEYDGNHIYGFGETGFKLYGFTGRIKVKYYDERFSGEGDINFKKGKASGKLHVKMSPEHKFSGSGELTYQITESLVGTAGIEIDEKEKVHLKGVLEFTKPLHFMDAAKGDYEIFHFDFDIPIPGLSIPKVGGINAVIKGGLFAGYQIGPGEIRNLKAKAEFDPFEDKPDLDITLSGQVHIGASAHITGTINGGVKLSILVASVSGGIGIAASATLTGAASSNIELHYHEGKFDAQADFKVLLDLILSLVICAWVHAEAGVWKFKVETTKVWNLKSFRYDTGLQLGMSLKKPLRYSSDEGVSLPSLSDIDWITPKIDTSDLLGKIFGSQDPSPDENVDGAQECGR